MIKYNSDGTIDLDSIKMEPDKTYSFYSVAKTTGLKIKDIEFYISSIYSEPLICISAIYFENGEKVIVDGEYELAYMYELPGIDEETFEKLLEATKDE